MRKVLMLPTLGLIASGCLEPDEAKLSYFRRAEPAVNTAALTPASTETAARVDTVGRQLLAANPQIGAKPMFHTVGAPHTEVFHRGTSEIFVTEGLVKQCATEAQLAAVLSSELGKLVRDREAQVPNTIRTREPLPPMDLRLGNDDRMGGGTDRFDAKEWAQYDKDRQARRKPALPDANVLAREYLSRAGFDMAELTNAQQLLNDAGAKTMLEKQIVPGVQPTNGP